MEYPTIEADCIPPSFILQQSTSAVKQTSIFPHMMHIPEESTRCQERLDLAALAEAKQQIA